MRRRKDGIDVPPAPGDLRLVQEFLNTRDLATKTDQLASPQALAGWLTVRRLMLAATELDDQDQKRTARFREGLRSLLGGGPRDRWRAVAALEESLTDARLRGRFDENRVLRFEPVAEGLAGALARLLAIVAEAQREGTWLRLKICISEKCRAAFYDSSRNRSAKFCSARCGSRITSATHRQRRRRAGLTTS